MPCGQTNSAIRTECINYLPVVLRIEPTATPTRRWQRFTNVPGYLDTVAILNGQIHAGSRGQTISDDRRGLYRLDSCAVSTGVQVAISRQGIYDLAGNGAQTAYKTMSADYRVEKGIARTNNLTIDGPGLNLTGAGHADLTTASLDLRMRARIFDGTKVTPAGDPVALFDLPIIIRGPWEKPSILPGGFGLDMASPEVEKVIRDVGEKLQDGDLGKIGDAIRKGNINDVLNALTGNK